MTIQEGPIKKPDLESYSDAPMFNTKSAVQQTGVPGPTLRAWERRYTLLAPERANNTYRLYSERDIVLIRWLKERVDTGMTISQAIAFFLQKQEVPSSNTSPQSETLGSKNDNASDSMHAVGEPGNQANVVGLRNGHSQASGKQDLQSQDPFSMIYSMRLVRERLVEAFNQLDESLAHMIMGSTLSIYPLDQVCTELITPTMWQIGQLWADGKITVSVEHFASTFFRALLTNLLYVTPLVTVGPMAVVCCAPGEPHELAPLMLSLFLRRSGVRVVYLGQSIETEGLLQSVYKLSPALLCVSLTMPTYLPAVIELAQKVENLPRPRPIFAFGGQVFAYNAHVIPQIPGMYLNGELKTIISQLHDMIVN